MFHAKLVTGEKSVESGSVLISGHQVLISGERGQNGRLIVLFLCCLKNMNAANTLTEATTVPTEPIGD